MEVNILSLAMAVYINNHILVAYVLNQKFYGYFIFFPFLNKVTITLRRKVRDQRNICKNKLKDTLMVAICNDILKY